MHNLPYHSKTYHKAILAQAQYKFSASYDYGVGDITLTGQYLGKSGYAKAVFLMDMIANFRIGENYGVYIAVDNMLNTRYELYTGYPMPGTKIRIGGSARF